MAKSFKQLTPKVELPKRNSEKDILDFLEQEKVSANDESMTMQSSNNTSNASNTIDTSNIGTDIMAQNDSVIGEDVDVRQTFIIGQQYMNRLKDFVHTKRVNGQYEYTQKQALHEALDRLFEGATIEERPAHIRQQEETRKQRIRRGITK
ncbi:hypothetical protein [Hymenobacter cavernae]|uniref:DUF3408 domain-containing protein n=1 Tax=Hymenobacter cavernae TaxID=2044852 RepID=A0ABQ1UVE4_9BACT|nr:hypothetical protein [Hymenobacter cavernae]GGF28077.1 hypothetical protein GCM10011383_44790 [Hymenobacter cavernae]